MLRTIEAVRAECMKIIEEGGITKGEEMLASLLVNILQEVRDIHKDICPRAH